MLSLDPNAVNQKYPGNDLVEEYFCSGRYCHGERGQQKRYHPGYQCHVLVGHPFRSLARFLFYSN